MYKVLRQAASRVPASTLLKTKLQPRVLIQIKPLGTKGELNVNLEDISIASAREHLLESGQRCVRYRDVAIAPYNILERLEARIVAKDELIKIMKENHAKIIKAIEEKCATKDEIIKAKESKAVTRGTEDFDGTVHVPGSH